MADIVISYFLREFLRFFLFFKGIFRKTSYFKREFNRYFYIAWKQQALEHGVDGISLWRFGGNERIKAYYAGLMP